MSLDSGSRERFMSRTGYTATALTSTKTESVGKARLKLYAHCGMFPRYVESGLKNLKDFFIGIGEQLPPPFSGSPRSLWMIPSAPKDKEFQPHRTGSTFYSQEIWLSIHTIAKGETEKACAGVSAWMLRQTRNSTKIFFWFVITTSAYYSKLKFHVDINKFAYVKVPQMRTFQRGWSRVRSVVYMLQ